MSSRVLAGRYELLEKIGDGGMAVVYKAKCKLLNRYVAIKILKPEFTKDLKVIESFRRESQAAASLSHPNIVNVFDVGQEGNIYFIVMELIEGRVLSDMIATEGPIDCRKATEITMQIAQALSFAHKNHIIHKDVKPHNILITPEGTAKITDFGIAKAVNDATIVGNADTVMGSVHYFSPEQARGGYVDEKSDIYSLGIVLYELITGKVPFDGDNPVAVALMHINEEMVPPSRYVKGIPPVLEQIILKATNKYQVNRFKSADEMLEALKNVDLIASIVGDSMMALGSSRADGSENYGENTDDGSYEERYYDSEDSAFKEKKKKMKNSARGKNDKTGKRKIKLNKVKVLAIIAALICAIPVSGLILSLINGFGEAKEVIVPDLAGMTFEQAEEVLEKLKLKIEEGEEVIDYEYEEGEIVSQDPSAESKVKQGHKITVNICKAGKEGTVPDLVGKSFEAAELLIEKYGFKKGSVTLTDSDLPKDIVVRQSVEAYSEAKPGTTINLYISKGEDANKVDVPEIVGMTADKAKEALEKAGLKPGTPSYESSTAYEKNLVMWQEKAAGEKIEKGSVINYKISKGNEPDAPVPVSLKIDFSNAKTPVFYMTVMLYDETGNTTTIMNREQQIKSDGSKTVSLTGTGKAIVTVIFDDEPVMEKNVDFNTGEVY